MARRRAARVAASISRGAASWWCIATKRPTHRPAGCWTTRPASGCEQQALDRDATVALEPALAGIRGDIAGAIYTPSEEVGDCHRFCLSLAHLLQGKGNVSMRFVHASQD